MARNADMLRLELLAATKDSEIAELRQRLIVEYLRQAVSASADAQFDPMTCNFVEPPAPPVDDTPTEVVG